MDLAILLTTCPCVQDSTPALLLQRFVVWRSGHTILWHLFLPLTRLLLLVTELVLPSPVLTATMSLASHVSLRMGAADQIYPHPLEGLIDH